MWRCHDHARCNRDARIRLGMPRGQAFVLYAQERFKEKTR